MRPWVEWVAHLEHARESAVYLRIRRFMAMHVVPVHASGVIGRDLEGEWHALAGPDLPQHVVAVAERRDVEAMAMRVRLEHDVGVLGSRVKDPGLVQVVLHAEVQRVARLHLEQRPRKLCRILLPIGGDLVGHGQDSVVQWTPAVRRGVR